MTFRETHGNSPARCDQHPKRRAARQCEVCGKGLCGECATQDKGKSYCAVHKFPGMRKRRSFNLKEADAPDVSPRSLTPAWALFLAGGVAGLHRFYVGRISSGLFRFALVAAYWRVSGTFPGMERPAGWFAILFLLGAAAKAIIGVFGTGFLFQKRGLGSTLGFRVGTGRGMILGGWVDRRMGWAGASPVLPKAFDGFMAFAIVILLVVFFAFSGGGQGEEGMGKFFLLVLPAMAGILWAGDAALLYHRRLTDWRGRVVL